MDKKSLAIAHRYLRKVDPVMAEMIERNGVISFSKKSQPHFHALVSAIINQQLSYKAGQTIEKRVLLKNGSRYFNTERILNIKPQQLRDCGLSMNKVRYILSLAEAVVSGELNFRKLSRKEDNIIIQELTCYPGIGPWSAEMFLMFSLRRMDVFPVGDLVIRRSLQQYYNIASDAKYTEYQLLAEKWQPYRTIASMYLWKNAD